MIKILSLDMQGTLTSSEFSDYFWLELLNKDRQNDLSLV